MWSFLLFFLPLHFKTIFNHFIFKFLICKVFEPNFMNKRLLPNIGNLLEINYIIFWNACVAEQRVTGPKLQGCVACVKPGTKIRVNLVASIQEWRRILSWSENQGSRICMGCMENGWSVCVGWDCWEMTALLMEWSGATFMKVRRE
jgi:hypothetical protein